MAQYKLWLYRGYLAEYTPKAWKPAYAHRFGGQHTIQGAECPNCRLPLIRYLELDTRDPRLHLDSLGVERLPLLFCPRCPLAVDGEFSYRLLATDYIEIVRYDPATESAEDYPLAYPERVASLVPMPDELQLLFRLFNRGYIDDVEIENTAPEWWREFYPRHQVGGEPLLVLRFSGMPNDGRIYCPVCHEEMAFFACVGNDYVDTPSDESLLEGGFHRGMWFGELLFHLCGRCRIVSAYYEGD